MDGPTATFVAGALGAVLGAAGSVLTVLIQARYQKKRELLKVATDVALRNYDKMLDMALKSGKPFTQLPLVVYLHYHVKLMDLIESGTFSPATYAALNAENEALTIQVDELDKEARAKGLP